LRPNRAEDLAGFMPDGSNTLVAALRDWLCVVCPEKVQQPAKPDEYTGCIHRKRRATLST
jgi:hypothetical protein